MKTIITSLFAGLVISVALGNGTQAEAQNLQSFVNGAINSIQKQNGGSFHGNLIRSGRHQSGRHLGHGHWNPRPNCTPSYCPPNYRPPNYCPPPRRVCYVYIVYVYDCHCGWKVYGEYHSHRAASHAVSNLQHQGQRAYFRTVQR